MNLDTALTLAFRFGAMAIFLVVAYFVPGIPRWLLIGAGATWGGAGIWALIKWLRSR